MKNKARAKGALRPKSESHRKVRIGDRRFSRYSVKGILEGLDAFLLKNQSQKCVRRVGNRLGRAL